MSKDRSDGTLVLSWGEINGTQPQTPPDGDACIVLLHPPGPDIGKRTPLTGSTYVVGRDNATADLVIPRSAVSRQHSRLVHRDTGGWWVEDMGSTNGTFVNEARITERKLVDGDQIRFGDTIFKFLTGSNIEANYHEEIYRMTIVDGLTGIYNKRYFLDFLDRELARAHRHHQPLALVMFDIDHFKRINDERGHLAGDAVLKELCNRIKPRIRREDLFARYGGEEFAAILTATELGGGVSFAENVRSLVARHPFLFDNQEIPASISLGVSAVVDEPELSSATLIKRADDNLYEAKRRGRDRVVPSLAEIRPGGRQG